MTDAPWTFGEARQKCLDAASAQEDAEQRVKDAYRDFADKQRKYKVALKKAMLRFKGEGFAISTCRDLARGDDHVALLAYERDLAEGNREAAVDAMWRHTANRKDAQRFAQWGERRELAEGFGQTPEPDWSSQPAAGRGVPPGVDPETGELRNAA